MTRRLSSATTLDTLRKQAKRWLRALRASDAAARARFDRAHPGAPAQPTLRDVQHALAREYGQTDWVSLRKALVPPASVASPGADTPEAYERVVADLLLAFNARDDAALQRLNARRGTSFTFDDLTAIVWRSVYAYRQRRSAGDDPYLLPDEARLMVAQYAGYSSWDALMKPRATRPARVPAYVIEPAENRVTPRRAISDAEWDELIAVAKERRITSLDAGGQMTDALLARVAGLEHITSLALGGSRQLTDDGLRHLARMPQLEQLVLNEYPGGRITDRGLEVLAQLPSLRTFEMTWQRGISDAGVRHLRACERLERVDLMGSPTGDGLIDALQGKQQLRVLRTGRLVGDAGLAMLRNIPRLVTPPPRPAAGHDDPEAVRLLVDGPFTNAGFAHLAGLAGVVDLDLFWHVTGITSEAFAHLARLPHLSSLGADGRLSDDSAMRHFGAMPGLRALRAQEAVATDAGFEALSRSPTLEGFWGRECPNFGSAGFLAVARMPALRSLGVGLKNVNDEALTRLPDFPALRDLVPIGLQDAGFRHVGRCARLERLTCMYCRETTDAATAHIAGLQLTYYYAGLARITDRSLQVLGDMATLEEVEFYECPGITDAGLPFLAALPRLRAVALDSLPGVTLEGTRVFPAHVRVRYST